MAISKNVEIKVRDDKATLSEKIFIYQNDKGIDLYFGITGLNYMFPQGGFKGVYATASLMKPDGSTTLINGLRFENEKIKFSITQEMTNELTEVGTHTLQFHLHDDLNKTNRLTIPEISFEVKEQLIGN